MVGQKLLKKYNGSHNGWPKLLEKYNGWPKTAEEIQWLAKTAKEIQWLAKTRYSISIAEGLLRFHATTEVYLLYSEAFFSLTMVE